MTKKKKDSAGPPSRRSLRLIEQARQEMLRQRKLAHGGHEVGDTSEDPLPIPSDEEKEVTPPPPPEGKVGSPSNPDYDSDYAEFLAEFLADDSLGDTPPASPMTPDTTFPASEVDRPSPPSQTPSMVYFCLYFSHPATGSKPMFGLKGLSSRFPYSHFPLGLTER
nr:uncharacterized protein LOC109166971 [Ipomoea trifida]GLL35238.1 uncharacterized protein LOC109166971 [Ipomoea trifida]